MTNVQQGTTDDLRGEMSQRAMEPIRKGKTVEEEIRGLREEFDKALPPGDLTAIRFERTVITELRKKPDLIATERTSLLGAIMTAAQLGLEFPLEQAYLVPFRDHGTAKTQLIIGYRGYIALARRSGDIKDIVSREIHEKDEYDVWSDEHGDHMIHRPFTKGSGSERGPIVRYFGRVRYTNGGVLIQDMAMDDIMARARRSASFNSKSTPWKSDLDAMCRKTVIRSMVPFLPLDASVAAFVGADEQVVRRMPDSTLVREYPEPPDVEEDSGIIEGQVISQGPEREEAEAKLTYMIESLPNRRDQNTAQRWLLDNFDSIPNLTDDRLAEATKALDEWLNRTPSATEPDPHTPSDSPPPASEPDQAAQGTQEAVRETPGPSEGASEDDPVTTEVLQEALEIRNSIPEDKRFAADAVVLNRGADGKYVMDGRAVNRALAQRQIRTRGTLDARRVLLAAHLSKEAYEAETEDPTTMEEAEDDE